MNDFFSINSTPLIALHGWGMDASAWDAIRPFVQSNLPLKAINLPGYLETSELPSMNMDNVVDWLATQFDGKCHLLGWSMGGLVAQAFTHKYPERVASLSLVGSTPCFIKKEGWSHALASEVLSQFVASLKDKQTMTLQRFIALQFMAESAAKDIQKQLRKSMTNHPSSPATLELGLSWLRDCDFRSQLSEMAIKQHWMFGELDQLVPAGVGEALQNEYPDIMISYFDGCGHAPHMTQPERFAETLLDFISQYTSK